MNKFTIKNATIALFDYTSIMSEICTKTETRGRPRKNIEEKLPPISRQLFSEHCAVFYACCMVYVLEVFLKTKQQKRIGHSEGGFTIYEKSSVVYCFDTFEDDIKEWGFGEVILGNRTANGCAPKFVFRELVTLFVYIHQFIFEQKIQSLEELQNSQNRLLLMSEIDLNRAFKYIRFTVPALKQLKMEKWSGQVGKKIRQLWRPFIKIISYTIFCVEKGIQNNKYLKPFFSDAEHPEETIIGQLNLEQIVSEKEEKIVQSSINLGFTKISKSNDDEQGEKVKPAELENSGSFANLTPQANRRPITLITFPSNPKLQVGSPGKLSLIQVSNRCQDEEQWDGLSPSKKLKLE